MNIAPPMPAFSAVRLPWLLLTGLHFALAVAAWYHGPGMNSDSATGFLLWDAWRSGFPWNHQPFPDPNDISFDTSLFQAWWSPGQYLAIAPLRLLGLNLGQAIAAGTFAWTMFGLFGWQKLFLRFGFGPAISAWSTALLAVNWTLVRNYGDYMGGELVLLSLTPWLVLGLWAAQTSPPARRFTFGPALVWLGAMAKNTFLPVAGGVLLARDWPALRAASRPWQIARLAGIVAVLAAGQALYWFTFLRHGWHPGSGGIGHLSQDATINLVRLVSFPLGGLASLQNLLGRLLFHPSAPLAQNWTAVWILLALLAAVLVLLAYRLICRELRFRPDYGRLLGCVTGGSLAFFAIFAVTRAEGGLEERFLRPCSFLFAPAALSALCERGPRFTRAALAMLLSVGAAYGAASGPVRARHLWRLDARDASGISQTSLGRHALDELARLDADLPANSLIVVSSPEMAFAIKSCRVWATHLEMQPVEFVSPRPLRGCVPTLVVVAGPGARAGGRDRALLARFADYAPDDWQETQVGEWSFYRQDVTHPPR